MANDHVMLGESEELCREAAKWGREEYQRIEKARRLRDELFEELKPLLIEKHKQYAINRERMHDMDLLDKK